MMPISFKNFMEENETLFSEIAFDINFNRIILNTDEVKTTPTDIACEHYQEYLTSIEDIDND